MELSGVYDLALEMVLLQQENEYERQSELLLLKQESKMQNEFEEAVENANAGAIGRT